VRASAGRRSFIHQFAARVRGVEDVALQRSIVSPLRERRSRDPLRQVNRDLPHCHRSPSVDRFDWVGRKRRSKSQS
jgi:hypothetical protein